MCCWAAIVGKWQQAGGNRRQFRLIVILILNLILILILILNLIVILRAGCGEQQLPPAGEENRRKKSGAKICLGEKIMS